MTSIDNKLPFAREGLPFIIVPLALGIGAFLAGGAWLGIILCAVGLFSAWFFRDPDRIPPPDESAILSPADGTVILIDRVMEDRFLNREMIKISIFMSVFNVHVNRATVSGTVERVIYFPGKFFAANLDKASRDNEHNVLVINGPGDSQMLVVQIAGLIARRIVCWVKPGDRVIRGQRFGLIRFGSRLDVYVSPDIEPTVQIGQKVKAGLSVLGNLP
jgi:phosphatidylserine decarboxylase